MDETLSSHSDVSSDGSIALLALRKKTLIINAFSGNVLAVCFEGAFGNGGEISAKTEHISLRVTTIDPRGQYIINGSSAEDFIINNVNIIEYENNGIFPVLSKLGRTQIVMNERGIILDKSLRPMFALPIEMVGNVLMYGKGDEYIFSNKARLFNVSLEEVE